MSRNENQRRLRLARWPGLLVLVLAVGGAGCGVDQPTGSPPSVFRVIITPDSATITMGGSTQLTAVALDAEGDPLSRAISWSSSDSAVASVNNTGQVTGVAPGAVEIIAAAEQHSDTAVVEVLGGAGSLTISVTTSGSFMDPDGYFVSIDNGTPLAIDVNDAINVGGLAEGSHSVGLSGISSSCLVSGDNPRLVSVASDQGAETEFEVGCTQPPTTTAVPLMDMGAAVSYHGFGGGLYPGGRNDLPAAHLAVQPQVDKTRRFALISVSMSNGAQEFCFSGMGNVGPQDCTDFSFIGQAAADPALHDSLVIVNTAQGSRPAPDWDSPSDETYDVADDQLQLFGLAPAAVQVAWIKQANRSPNIGLPNQSADAYRLLGTLGDIVRSLKSRYPNIKQVYLSSRIYSCRDGGLNGEPFAYESGFSVKWLIAAQIEQLASGTVDPLAGDLGLDVAPWIAWGPYLWADGTNPRSDGLVWERGDLADDCTHPSSAGQQKVGALLMEFFKTSPLTTDWFVR